MALGSFWKDVVGLPFSARQTRLARERPALSETEFIRRITDEGGDALAAARIWRHLRDWTVEGGFTPYPTDSLGTVFGIAEEELDEDLILAIFRDFHIPPPSTAFLSRIGVDDTPLRIAQIVTLCRKPPVAGENPSIRELIMAQLKQMTHTRDGDVPIADDTELYYDLRIFGHNLRDLLLWISHEAGVPISLNLAEHAPPEGMRPLLFRKRREHRERQRRPYKSLTVRDVLEFVERSPGAPGLGR